MIGSDNCNSTTSDNNDPPSTLQSNCEGNYIISAEDLCSTITLLHTSCPPSCMKLIDIREERSGHLSAVKFSCSMCSLSFYVTDTSRNATSFRESKQLNTTFAFASDLVGLDYTTLSKFCAVIGIDGPPDSYDSVYQKDIFQKLQSAIESKFVENRMVSHTSRNQDGSSLTRIPVKCDGTYQKRGDRSRGYTSKIGVTVIFDADTDLPIDYEIESKYCHTCTQMKSKFPNEAEYGEWLLNNPHDCEQNFTGASTEMERRSLKKMFDRSTKDRNLVYKYLVSDGDCKGYNDIWDAYELCDHCNKHKDKLDDKAGDAYKEWSKSDDFKEWCRHHADITYECDMVLKIDCVGHVSKNFASKVETLAKSERRLTDNKSINRGSHRLGKESRVKLQRNFRNAVKKTVRKGVRNEVDIKEGIDNMRKAIMAVLHHSSDLEPKERHQYCPNEGWCLYKTSNPDSFQHQSHHFDKVVFDELLPIFQNYTQTPILQKMLPGYTTNLNEAYNHVLWSIIPKSMFHGKRRQEISTMLALVLYQGGYHEMLQLFPLFHIPLTTYAAQLFLKLDKNKEYCRSYKFKKQNKIYEARLSCALEHKRSLTPGYSAGCLGVSDTISGSINLPPTRTNPAASGAVSGQFIAIPFGAMFFVGEIQVIDPATEECCIKYMYRTGQNSFVWREKGEEGYEEPTWEYLSSIIAVVNPPEPINQRGYCLSDDDYAKVCGVFSEWKQNRNKRSKRK